MKTTAQHAPERRDGEGETRVADIRVEQRGDACGIGTATPRLSWTVATATEGWLQEAYEIEAHAMDGQQRATTGRVTSRDAVLMPWPFAPLASRERLTVRVRVWGDDGQPSTWSAPSRINLRLPG